MWQSISILIWKEFTLELRKKSVVAGLALYLVSLTFTCYLAFNFGRAPVQPPVWAALFWITVLFTSIHTIAKSFIGERVGLTIYYFTIAPAKAIIVSKILYNTILSFTLAVVAFMLMQFLIPASVGNHGVFFLSLFLTSAGLSSALSLVSGIASRAANSHVIMAVLTFPIVIAILLMAIRITKNVLDGLEVSASYNELLNLLAINCIMGTLAYLLFPYIWRS